MEELIHIPISKFSDNLHHEIYFSSHKKKKSAIHSCPTLSDPVDTSLPGFSVRGILLSKILQWTVIPFSKDLSDPGIEPRSPTLHTDSYHLSHEGSLKEKWLFIIFLCFKLLRIDFQLCNFKLHIIL